MASPHHDYAIKMPWWHDAMPDIMVQSVSGPLRPFPDTSWWGNIPFNGIYGVQPGHTGAGVAGLWRCCSSAVALYSTGGVT